MPETLKTQWFHILLALAKEELHGYGIQREVKEATGGGTMLWPGMLYRSLDALVKRKWIEPIPDPSEEPDVRRQYYKITAGGKRRLATEAELLGQWAELARGRTS